MNKLYFEVEDDVVNKYTPVPEMEEDAYKSEIVMTKEIFQECYEKWIDPQKSENKETIKEETIKEEPYNDVISKQAVLEALWKLDIEIRPAVINAITDMIEHIPYITPQLNVGREKSCEMTVEEYRERMIQAFHNAGTDELIAICTLPTEKEFKHLEWLLKTHYKKKSCDDVVSRKELLKIYEDRFLELQRLKHSKDNKDIEDRQMGVNYCINILKELPSVTPQPKRGLWITLKDKYGDVVEAVCQNCGENGNHKWAFCPNCGVKMERRIDG